MARRTRRSRRARRGVTIGVLLLASITVITLDYRGDGRGAISWVKHAANDAFSPLHRGLDAVVRPIGSFLAGAVHAGAIEQQNAKLRNELNRAQSKLGSAQLTRNELQALERLDHLPWVGDITTVTATVVALNPSNFAATVQLDKGTAQGVAVGMPVVAGAGLVGQVVDSWSSGCTIRLVTDAASAVGVRYGSGGLALVQGTGLGRPLAVNYVDPGTPLSTGTLLVTSGLQNAKFPPDIPVARVTHVSSTPSATQESVSAQSVADLAQLQYVDVLLWSSSSS